MAIPKGVFHGNILWTKAMPKTSDLYEFIFGEYKEAPNTYNSYGNNNNNATGSSNKKKQKGIVLYS